MGRIRQVRKEDGTLEPFRERKIADAIHQSLVAIGQSDRPLADELAGVVALFLEKYHGDTVPSLSDVDQMSCRVLEETGHSAAARRFEELKRERGRLAEEVTVRSLPGREADAIPGGPAEEVHPWSRERLVRSLVRAGELPIILAEEIAASVENRVSRADLRSVTPALIRELVDHELLDRGLEVPRHDPVPGVSREEMMAIVSGSVPDSPDRAIAGRVLEGYALSGIHTEEVTKAHHEGRLHLHGLTDPLKVERLTLPSTLVLPPNAHEGSVGDALLFVRATLDRIRPHVRAELTLPDLVGAIARHPEAAAHPEEVVTGLLAALDFRDVYGAPRAPLPHLVVPLTNCEDAAADGFASNCIDELLCRLEEAPEQGDWLPVSLAIGDGELPDSESLQRTLKMAATRHRTLLAIRRDGDNAIDGAGTPLPVPLTISLGRVSLNLPLALADAHGAGLKEVLPELDGIGATLRAAFHERFWYQRGGAHWGLHGVVVGLGGPGRVQVHAQGQEIDLDVWGLGHALEMLVRRGAVHPSRRPEAAARILGYLDYLLGEEVQGVQFRVRLGGTRDREVRRRLLQAVETTGTRYGIIDVVDLVRDATPERATLPVVVPLLSERNRSLLDAPFSERTGPGLSLPLAAFGSEDPRSLIARLRDETRLGQLTLAPRQPGEDLFEVQEELFA